MEDEPQYAEYELAEKLADALADLLVATKSYSGPLFDKPKRAAKEVLAEWEEVK